MKWYGLMHQNTLPNNSLTNSKKRLNISTRSTTFSLSTFASYRHLRLFLWVPIGWQFLLIKNYKYENLLFSYFYTQSYYFFICFPSFSDNITYDSRANVVTLSLKFFSNFFLLYWKQFLQIFYSFNRLFFRKLKFKGKGYYMFKNLRNTIALQFGYSHRVRVYVFFLTTKFLTKSSIIFYGINSTDLDSTTFKLFYKKPINIFTSKGIRFNRQIVYKKTGKVSSYR